MAFILEFDRVVLDDSPMASQFEAFVISMESNDFRRSQAKRILAACPIPCSLIAAVDGSTLRAEARSTLRSRPLHRPNYPFALRPAEIGCFLSHRIAWQMILDRDLDGALILEDDVELVQPEFGRCLEVAFDSLRFADLVRLRLMERTPGRIRGMQEPARTQPMVTALGTQAQVVGRQGASRLLEASQTFDRPVDVFIQMRWLSGITTCEVAPSYVFDRTQDLGGSTIQVGSRGFKLKFLRNVNRTLYRTIVYLLSFVYPRLSPAKDRTR